MDGFGQPLRRYDNGSDRHLHPRRERRLAGTIKTLTLNVKATIKPCDRDNDKAPDYRVTANGIESEPAGAGPLADGVAAQTIEAQPVFGQIKPSRDQVRLRAGQPGEDVSNYPASACRSRFVPA